MRPQNLQRAVRKRTSPRRFLSMCVCLSGCLYCFCKRSISETLPRAWRSEQQGLRSGREKYTYLGLCKVSALVHLPPDYQRLPARRESPQGTVVHSAAKCILARPSHRPTVRRASCELGISLLPQSMSHSRLILLLYLLPLLCVASVCWFLLSMPLARESQRWPYYKEGDA